MVKAIWFDMDGTIANLYGVENWLPKLLNGDPTPYAEAAPLLPLQPLARRLNRLQAQGWTINIITWLAKGATAEYNEKVAAAKTRWLKKHLATVKFDNIDIVPYGTPKGEGREGILFDDEEPNRQNWGNGAYNATEIVRVLRAL